MSPVLRVIIWLFGSLFWIFWMYLAYMSDFLGMFSDGDDKKPYFFRCFFSRIPFNKTPQNKKKIFICLSIFGIAIVSALCFLT